MNSRRHFLLGLTTSVSLGVAGCSADQSGTDETKTPAPTPEPTPEASWSDEPVTDLQYHVSVEVQLNGADFLEVRKGTPQGNLILAISESGQHQVAGPLTPNETVQATTGLFLVRPTEDEFGYEINKVVSSRVVGKDDIGAATDKQTATKEETQETEAEPAPGHLAGLTGSTLPNPENKDLHKRVFEQSYGSERSKFTLHVPDALYQYYNNRPRVGDYSAYLSDMFDEEAIQGLANSFEDYGKQQGHSDRQIVNHAIAWVQGMKYTQDKPATGYNEYPKYPIETLYDRGGDCEDTSIVLAGVLEKLGYSTRLIELPDANHMAVGVAGGDDLRGANYTDNGTKYYYVETTGEGWRVGEVPESVQNQGTRARLRPIDPSPVLALEWNTNAKPGTLKIDLTIHNIGSKTAGNVAAQIDVENPNGNIVAQERAGFPSISEQSNATKTLSVDVPTDEDLRLRFGALLGGSLNDMKKTESYSS